MATAIRSASKIGSYKKSLRAKTQSKASIIRNMLVRKKTPPQIKKALEKRGFSVYPSEIYGQRDKV